MMVEAFSAFSSSAIDAGIPSDGVSCADDVPSLAILDDEVDDDADGEVRDPSCARNLSVIFARSSSSAASLHGGMPPAGSVCALGR